MRLQELIKLKMQAIAPAYFVRKIRSTAQLLRWSFAKPDIASKIKMGTKQVGLTNTQPSIVTMQQSIRAMQGLELTVHSILNDTQFEFLNHSILEYLKKTRNDDNYIQIYNATREFLTQAIEHEMTDSLKKSILIAALSRLQIHFIQTNESKHAYNPISKPNPQAVYYPNPSYGQSLYDQLPFVKNIPLINTETPIGILGDTLAETIINFLQDKQYNIYKNKSYTNLRAILTPSILCQIIEFAFELTDASIFHSDFDDKNLRTFLTENEVFFLTINSTEVRQITTDSSRGNLSLNLEDTLRDLQKSINIWQAFNPRLKIIFSISHLSFQPTIVDNNENSVCNSSYIKALLRVALENITKKNSAITFYFPAFEAITCSTRKPFIDNMQNLSTESTDKLTKLFEKMYLK